MFKTLADLIDKDHFEKYFMFIEKMNEVQNQIDRLETNNNE